MKIRKLSRKWLNKNSIKIQDGKKKRKKERKKGKIICNFIHTWENNFGFWAGSPSLDFKVNWFDAIGLKWVRPKMRKEMKGKQKKQENQTKQKKKKNHLL